MTQGSTSEWLAELDSHTLYHADMLKKIPGVTVAFDFVRGPMGGPIAVLYRNDHKGPPMRMTLQTLASVAKNPGKAGVTMTKGYDPDQLAFSAFYLASRLAMLFLGTSPGSLKSGRGFAFRADLEALRAAGF